MLTLLFAPRLVVVDRVEDTALVVELAPHRVAVVERACVPGHPREGESLRWHPPVRLFAGCPYRLEAPPLPSPERTALTTPQGVHP